MVVHYKICFGINYGMIPEGTVHKVTSKRHKTDEKSTHFVLHVPPSVFGVKKIIPLHPAPIQKYSGLYIKPPQYLWINVDHRFVSFWGLVPPPPPQIISL